MSVRQCQRLKLAYVFPGGVDRVGGAETQALHFFRGHDRSRFLLALVLIGDNPEFRGRAERIEGVTVVLLRSGLFRGPISFLRHLRVARYDLVHLYGLRVEVFARPLASIVGHARVVSAIRGTESHRNWVHVALNRLTSRWVDLWISNSDRARQVFMMRDRVSPDRIIVVRSGVPAPARKESATTLRARARTSLGLPEDSFVVALVGNHTENKRQCDLVEAIAICASRGQNVLGCFIGQRSEYSDRFENLAREKQVAHLVRCSGPATDVQVMLPAMDVLVLPSLDEGLPAAILEGMMAGLPVIATNVGGTAEVVEDGVTGFLIGTKNPELLAERIGQLFKDRALRDSLGAAGHARVVREYSVQSLTTQLQSHYQRLLLQDGA